MSKKLIAGAGVVASFAIALAPLATFATTPSAGNEYVSQLDKLSVTIEPYCSFGYAFKDGSTTTAHGLHTNGGASTSATTIKNTTTYGDGSGQYGAGGGNWHNGTAAFTDLNPSTTTDEAADVAYGVMENGTYNLNFAKTKLTVVCNNRAGYSITASSEDLEDDAEAVSDVFAQTNATPSGAASTWSFQFQNASGFALNNRTEGGSAASAAAWLDAKTNNLVVASMAPTTTGDNQNPSAATTATGDSYEATYGVGVSSTMPAGTYSGTILYTLAQL